MAELVACLHRGNVEVLRPGEPARALHSPYLEQLTARDTRGAPRITSVTRGRTSGELCYAISGGDGCEIFTQTLGRAGEQRLFRSIDTQLSELDFSSADEALACTVAAAEGISAIGVFSDDGKGLRTVTEGDVIDRAPRWAPGGRGEIVYASAGIGRTKAGRAVGRSPFALHRLRFSDSSVEVLMADAHYDYAAVVPVSPDVLYALRRNFDAGTPTAPFARVAGAFRSLFSSTQANLANHASSGTGRSHELVRITPQGTQLVQRDVFAFDITEHEDLVYSSEAGVFRIAPGESKTEQLSARSDVEQLVIHW